MDSRKGFTLVEIVLAIALMAIVLTAIAGICLPLKRSIDVAKERQQTQESIELVWHKMAQDLSFAWEPQVGDAPFFIGEANRMEFFCLDSIRFAGEPFIPGTRKVVYQYQKEEALLEWGETPLAQSKKESPFFTLTESLADFQFRYLGKSGWQIEWNDLNWPQAIQVTGVYLSGQGKGVSFEHTFYPQI